MRGMFEAPAITAADKPALYRELASQVQGLLHGERNLIANAANFSALVFNTLPDISWCGFYFAEGDGLVVGPFQGKPACVRIALGKGVCGTAAQNGETQLVPDVHAFPGHIACDAASASELVVPVLRGGAVIAVIDLDSPDLARFDAEDAAGIEALAAAIAASI